MSEETKNEEYAEHDYPEGTLGWKVNCKIAAVEEQALKSGLIFLSVFTVLLLPAIIEILYYSIHMYGPFLTWRAGLESYSLAQWHMVVYVVILLLFSSVFFYYGVRLFWHGLHQRKK